MVSGLSMSSHTFRTGRPLYNERMSDEEVILEEANRQLAGVRSKAQGYSEPAPLYGARRKP